MQVQAYPAICLLLLAAGCSTQTVSSGHAPGVPASPVVTTVNARPHIVPSEPRHRGSEGWRVRSAGPADVEGFTTRVGGPPGTVVGVKASTSARSFRLLAYRIGSYVGGSGHLVWRSRPLRGRVQAEPGFAPYETRTVVADWRTDVTVDTTGWTPGFYVLKLKPRSGRGYQIPYVVTSPSASGKVALVAPVTNWQAYNIWGGYSLYDGPSGDRRSRAVSFDRPYTGVLGANDYRTAVIPIVLAAERLGVPLAYFTNIDVHADPGTLAGARGYVSMSHDEYWTPAMRDRVTAARDRGTNLAFLGANTMYWRVRLEPRNGVPHRLMVGYRHDAHNDPLRESNPVEATSRFRDAPAAHPENELVGMLYECYPVDTDYVVVSPDWWGFRGTGVRHGSRIHGLVGPESDRVYPDESTPRPMQVLSHSSFDCRGDTTSTQSVYYTSPSGAGVFTAGTLRWGCALVDRCERPLGDGTRRFVQRVTANLVRAFAAGPVGKRHPARDNVAEFDLPLVNAVSAS
jgi:hypothetical protein